MQEWVGWMDGVRTGNRREGQASGWMDTGMLGMETGRGEGTERQCLDEWIGNGMQGGGWVDGERKE